MFKSVESLQQISRSQMEATTQSAAALSRGMQQIAAEASDLSKKSMEETSAVFGKLMGVKSIESMMEIQSDYAKTSYETMMAGMTRMGDLMTSLAKDAYKPFEQARAFAK